MMCFMKICDRRDVNGGIVVVLMFTPRIWDLYGFACRLQLCVRVYLMLY